MKNLGKTLISEGPFEEIMIGNTALVRAMVEAETEVVTSYPGSPTPEIAAGILSIPQEERPFYFEFSVNEKVATEIAMGASLNGRFSTVFFKSVGLNIAADTFVQLPMFELIGGMVIVLGDDPGANSSQNEQDNRHYARMSYAPVFEPGDPQEVYEMYLEAARLARENRMPIILRLSTHICHAKTKVRFGRYKPRQGSTEPCFDPANGPYIPLTERALDLKRKALEKLSIMKKYSESCPFNQQTSSSNRRGIVTSGLPYFSLRDVLVDSGNETPDILKVGMSYPLPQGRLVEFCMNHREVLVLEELDPVIETELKAFAFDAGLKVRIMGKLHEEDLIGEYSPTKTRSILQRVWPELFPGLPADVDQNAEVRGIHSPESSIVPTSVPERPAQMCPGCGHRSAFYAVKKALQDEDITVADIGCHTLGALPPYRMGQVLTSMGHSTATGSGLALFNTSRKVVAFIGDSTFFHAGIPGIVNAVYNHHNLTLIVMENGTTAMTGHQEHPGTGKTVNGPAGRISIRSILEAIGVSSITETDTYQQKKLIELVREAVQTEGFSVVIARHPCMLKFTRDRRKRGRELNAQAVIKQDTCRQIHECVSEFACPSFFVDENGKVTVNSDLCIGDGSCMQTCPVQAIELKGVGHSES
ncbi:MAG: thiamine pyrophosphate-dependent enzyme [Sediminispirochaetaceae bacterium]